MFCQFAFEKDSARIESSGPLDFNILPLQANFVDKQFTTALVINYKIFKSKGPELSILAESFSKANYDPNRIFFKGKNITSKLKVTSYFCQYQTPK